ncbi:G-box-binding factor-like [Lucilia sericata]|uniref:G-box-binding factor-like n=1 Tax=Lucilia sericata TaxID=13632 RepID=UPI0018A85573|nr:G-box-binding factor-like [Lucilia sericata]
MSDEVPSGRLSQIFDPLTNLQQQPSTTHYQQQLAINRRRSASSSPSPSTSGRATPASLGGGSNGSGASSSTSSHFQHYQQHQQQNYQYLTQTHNYFHVRAHDVGEREVGVGAGGGGFGVGHGVHNYLHTFPSTHTPSHLQQQHLMQQQYHHYQQHNAAPMMPSSYLQHTQQQQHSLPPQLYATSQSLTASPLLTKRAISFSGQIPLNRQQMDNLNVSAAGHKQHQHIQQTAQSTPNSPRLMPRRQAKPPPIPAKPTSIPSTSSTTSSSSNKSNQKEGNGVINPVSSLDGADAPWPHFSSLTDYLDVHQVNNYAQPVPEINWQERCLELQLELHRSKNQAGRIRDMLREKVSAKS